MKEYIPIILGEGKLHITGVDTLPKSYSGIHRYIQKRLPKPDRCQDCNKITIHLQLANIGHTYILDIKDWRWLCPKCHGKMDAPIKKWKQIYTKCFKHSIF